MTHSEMIEMLNISGLGKILLLDEHAVVRSEPITKFAELIAAKELEKASERAWVALIKRGADWSVRQMVSDAITQKGEA